MSFTASATTCLLSGETSFFAPNKIDFKRVETEFRKLDETGNVVVLGVVLSIFVIYCIVVIAV